MLLLLLQFVNAAITGHVTRAENASRRSCQSASALRRRVPFPATVNLTHRWPVVWGTTRPSVRRRTCPHPGHHRRPPWRATWTMTSTSCEICARLTASNETRLIVTHPSTPESTPPSVTVCWLLFNNPQHVLQVYLDERPQLCYNLRKRTRNNKTLIEKTVDLNDRDFLIRNLCKYSYWLVFLSSTAIMYFLSFLLFFYVFTLLFLNFI